MSQPLIDLRRQYWYTGLILSRRDDYLMTCNLDSLCRTSFMVRGDKITKVATTLVPYEGDFPVIMLPVIEEESFFDRPSYISEQGMLKRMRNVQKLDRNTFRIRKRIQDECLNQE